MSTSARQPRYLLRWDHSQGLMIDRDVVVTGHRIGEMTLASDQRLADIIDQHPSDAISVHTMGTNPAHRNEWQTGKLGQMTGTELVAAIRYGRLWLVLHDVARFHGDFQSLTNRLCSEIAECHVGFRIRKPAADLVFASPFTMQYYRCDVRPTIRWQLHGEQRVWTYPATLPFVHPRSVAQAIISQHCDGLYFEPDFDQHARIVHAVAAQMISLPHSTPYRVQCGAGLNVWLQTEHDTTETQRQRNILLANRKFCKLLPVALCGDQTSGAWASIKNAYAQVAKLTDEVPSPLSQAEPTFVVTAVTEENATLKNGVANDLSGTTFDANTTTNAPSAVLEN